MAYDLATRVSELTALINAWKTNSKQINQLTDNVGYEEGMLIPVYSPSLGKAVQYPFEADSTTLQARSEKNQAEGYLGLDEDTLIPTTYIPNLPISKITSLQTNLDRDIFSMSITGDTNKILTLTKFDGTTLTESFTDIDTDTDLYLNGLNFNTANGAFTAVLNDTSTSSVNLDGRWSLLGHTHTFASLTSKPTTISGYGITDYNSLWDTRFDTKGVYTTSNANLSTVDWAAKDLTASGTGLFGDIVTAPNFKITGSGATTPAPTTYWENLIKSGSDGRDILTYLTDTGFGSGSLSTFGVAINGVLKQTVNDSDVINLVPNGRINLTYSSGNFNFGFDESNLAYNNIDNNFNTTQSAPNFVGNWNGKINSITSTANTIVERDNSSNIFSNYFHSNFFIINNVAAARINGFAVRKDNGTGYIYGSSTANVVSHLGENGVLTTDNFSVGTDYQAPLSNVAFTNVNNNFSKTQTSVQYQSLTDNDVDGEMNTIAYLFSEGIGWGYNKQNNRVFYNSGSTIPFWVDEISAKFDVNLAVNGEVQADEFYAAKFLDQASGSGMMIESGTNLLIGDHANNNGAVVLHAFGANYATAKSGINIGNGSIQFKANSLTAFQLYNDASAEFYGGLLVGGDLDLDGNDIENIATATGGQFKGNNFILTGSGSTVPAPTTYWENLVKSATNGDDLETYIAAQIGTASYTNWLFKVGGVLKQTVADGNSLDFVGGTGIDLSYSAGVVTAAIDSTVRTTANFIADTNFKVPTTIAASSGSSSYTITTTDKNLMKPFSNSAISITIDSGSLSNINDEVYLYYTGTGTLTIIAGTATIRKNENSTLTSDGQYSVICIKKIGASEYVVFGQLASV